MLDSMARPYEFFEHTADIGVTVRGSTLEELFRNAAAALYEALGSFEVDGRPPARTLTLQAGSPEDLLHDWLAELLFDFEARHLLYDRIEFTELDPRYCAAIVSGGTVDFARSQPHEEIKGVTYHQLRVEQLPGGAWQATVIFDV